MTAPGEQSEWARGAGGLGQGKLEQLYWGKWSSRARSVLRTGGWASEQGLCQGKHEIGQEEQGDWAIWKMDLARRSMGTGP
jgi:hypothetical protein